MELVQKEIEIDDVKYVLTQGNFFESRKEAEKLMSLLRGVIDVKLGDKEKGGFALDIKIPEILANITGEDFQGTQKFILSKMQVIKDGQGVPTSKESEMGAHFNKHRSHYYKIIIEGAKFHFLDFLPFGKEQLQNIIKQATKTAQTNQT